MTAETKAAAPVIHPTAIVDRKAGIAEGVEIGPFCVVGPDVTIGTGTRLLNNVTILNRATIGRRNVIHPHAVLGGKPQDLKYRGEDTEVVIGDQNTIREFVTINIGTTLGGGVTRIGNQNLLMSSCHIAHDVELGNNVVIVSSALLAGHVKVEDHVIVSAPVALHHFVTVGRHALVSGFARVNTDVPPFMIASGIPMEIVALNSVGLRRRGFSEERLLALKEAHRLLWRSGLPKSEAMALIEQRYPAHEDIRMLLEALRATDRGKQGRAREALRGAGWPETDEDVSNDGPPAEGRP